MKKAIAIIALLACCADLSARTGETLPNLSKMWTVWNGRNVNWNRVVNRDYPIDFVGYVELMAATGGSPERDCFKKSRDRKVLDDYDFAPLVKSCRGILAMKAKPYLKLGGVPGKFTEDYNGGSFRTNIRPPTDPMTHYNYMRACAAALKNEFGLDEVRTWRYSVLTESDNYSWFCVGDKDAAKTREAFFSLYDYTVRAFEEELGKGIVIGTHLLDPADCAELTHSFTAADFARHCRDAGVTMNLLTFSNYHVIGNKRSMEEIKQAYDEVRALGYTNLVTGIDEGRIIASAPGSEKKDLSTRAVGASYEAAYDVRIAKLAYDLGFDYLSTWGWFGGPAFYEGLPSHHYYTQREIAKFEGMKRIDVEDSGFDVVAAVSTNSISARVMVGCFTDKLDYTNVSEHIVSVRLPSAFAGRKVCVSTLTLDDSNNWWPDWLSDRNRIGIVDQEFVWSPDDFAVLNKRGLTNSVHRAVFVNELQPRYAEKARLVRPFSASSEVASDGTLKLPLRFVGNGAAFIEIQDDWSHPYISTYYLEPELEKGDECIVRYYVTDYDHSLVRNGDDSKRFDITLKLTTDREKFRVEKQCGVRSGDGEFNLGKLDVGDYFVGIAAKDLVNGFDSHTVWQRFRVIEKGARNIPADRTRVMSAADLKTYGLRNDGTYERFCKIELDENPSDHIKNFYTKVKEHNEYYLKIVDDYLAAHPHVDAVRPGYCVYVPSWKGVPVTRAFERMRVVYDKDYDKDRVAAEALSNSDGLQRFIDEAASNGFRKVIFHPGVYRVSHERTLSIPSNMTLDLGGATLKLNGFAGQHGMMVKMAAVENAHLVNGTLEGDYFEHHYGAPDTGHSEWVCGYTIRSCSSYCSVSNVVLKNITGYGGTNGMGKEGPPSPSKNQFFNSSPWVRLDRKIGKLIDISGFQQEGFISVSKALGYQGIRTRGWNYHVEFFDAATNLLSREVGFQYRDLMLDPRAKFARFEIKVANDEERRTNDLSVVRWKAPWNCRIGDCRFERCRAVGMAPAQMKNFLIRGNYFTECGETLACCAFDAEDGWDGMQDILIKDNVFENNYRSELLTCAGHNFMVVGNRGRIHLWGRTFSPYVVSNVATRAVFDGGPRTRMGYARFSGNDFNPPPAGEVSKSSAKKFPDAHEWADPILIQFKVR